MKHVPIDGTDLESNEARIAATKSCLLYNIGNKVASKLPGGNAEVLTSYEGNVLLQNITFPGGEPASNYLCCGAFESKNTDKIYVMVVGSAHCHIYRINQDQSIQFVYSNPDLNFQRDPKYFISEGRCVLKQQSYVAPGGVLSIRSFLIFTDNYNDQRCICVEDSIATNSFDATAFPHFVDIDPNWNKIYLVNLGVQPPFLCPDVTPSPRVTGDALLHNLVYKRVWRFRVKYIDCYERPSEHSVISPQYISLTGGDCFGSSNALPRCLKVKIPAGNPQVDKIQIEVSLWGNGTTGLNTPGEWLLYDVLYKYERNDALPWYSKAINPDLSYNSGDNTINFIFCADKETEPIDVKETTRLYNPLPLMSSGVTPVGDQLTLLNNVRDFNQLAEAQLKKIAFTVTPPGAGACGLVPQREIILYAVIYAPYSLMFGTFSPINPSTHLASWGSSWITGGSGQVCPNQGFTGYLAGTNYSCVSTMVEYNFATGLITSPGTPIVPADNGRIILHKFHFTGIRPGEYSFRISNHNFIASMPGYQRTSTRLGGEVPLTNFQIFNHGSFFGFVSPLTNTEKQRIINCATADYNPGPATLFQIYDFNFACEISNILANPDGTFGSTFGQVPVWDGYLCEDEFGKLPYEKAPCTLIDTSSGASTGDSIINIICTDLTDHNGYFFGSAQSQWDGTTPGGGHWVPDISIFGARPCPLPLLCEGTLNVTGSDCTSFITKSEVYMFTGGGPTPTIVFGENYYLFTGITLFPDAGRRFFKGTMQLCGTAGIGVAGVLVVDKWGQYTTTDTNGNFVLIGHNRDGSAPWSDTLIISQSGGCLVSNCADPCIYVFAHFDLTYLPCGHSPVGCTTSQPDRTICLGTTSVSVSGANLYGPQTGGLYNLGVVAHDWMGRCTPVMTDDSYIANIPSLITTQVFAYSKIGWSINPTISLPPWVKFISFWITENLRFRDFRSWTVDLVDFVDNAGVPTAVSLATQIKIYYKSLSEYNVKNNLSTNTPWQFIVDQNNAKSGPVLGDYVEFIMNGNGTFFATNITAQVKFDQQGIFFLIDFTNDLSGLIKGGLIRIIRPREISAEEQNAYFELCPLIPVVGGVPTILSGTFDYVDSYFLYRQIPIPTTTVVSTTGSTTEEEITTEQGNDGQVTTKTVLVNGTGTVQISRTADVLTSFTFMYEHISPSDFWGGYAHTKGRVNFKNPFQRQRRNFMEAALSADMLFEGDYNGLSYFDTLRIKEFNQHDWGQIVVMIGEVNLFIVVCERDHFLVGYNNNQLVVSKENLVTVASGENQFGSPNDKRGENYGCQFVDINTIRRNDGKIMFLDRTNSAIIFSNYTNSKRVDPDQCSTYVFNKVAWQNVVRQFSGDAASYNVSGVNPRLNLYFLTSFQASNTSPHVTTLTQINIIKNETMVFDMETGQFKGMVGFTPEYYISFRGFNTGSNYFAFKAGQPYKQDGNIARNNFFGVQCKKSIGVVVNALPDSEKRFMYTEVYCKEHKFIIQSATTDGGQLTNVPAGMWDKREFFYCASIPCDVNTAFDPAFNAIVIANPLLDGNSMIGKWMKIFYVSEDADDNKYCEVVSLANYFIESPKTSD